MRLQRSKREIDEELAFHMEQQVEANIAAGMPAEEARRRAMLEFGSMEATREQCRELRPSYYAEAFLQDTHYAMRTLRKAPGFTVIALLMLALGIGATTTIFSVVNALLLHPLAYPEADRLVLLWGVDAKTGAARDQVSFTDTDDIRHQNSVFEELANFGDWKPTLSGAGEAERLYGTQVSDGFFKVLGAKPLLGRFFTPEEQVEGKDNVVVLSYGLWQRKFSADPQIIGKQITLATIPHTVVGVLPADFAPLPSTLIEGGDLYRPVAEARDDTQRRSAHLRAIARLKPGVSLKAAQEQVDVLTKRLAAANPLYDADLHFHLASLRDDTVGGLKSTVYILFAAVGLLLVILCVNLANLLLVRSSERRQEYAVRSALGASRSRLVAQMLVESLLLSVGGTLMGVAAAYAATRAISAWAGAINSQLASLPLDGRVVAFASAIAAITGIAFGLAPALLSSSAAMHETLKEHGRGIVRRRTRLQNAFVVIQIATAMALLVAGGLLAKSYRHVVEVDAGFTRQQVLTMNVSVPYRRYKDPETCIAFYERLLEQVQRLPGVRSAAVVQNLPLQDFDSRAFMVEGKSYKPGEHDEAEAYYASEGYLQTMGIPVLRGRGFSAADDQQSTPVALVSAALAKQLWPGEEPLGKRIGRPESDHGPVIWRTVVGVVGDIKHFGLDKPAPPALYVPFKQTPMTWMSLVVSGSGNLYGLVQPIRAQIARLDPDVAAYKVSTFADLFDQALGVRRFSFLLVAAFGCSALLLAVLGVYGVISYSIVQRHYEIGIRLALGAQRKAVLGGVLRAGFKLVGIGVVCGIAVAAASSRLLSSLLFAVSPMDGTTFVAGAGVLLACALIATAIPAARAALISPLVALRGE